MQLTYRQLQALVAIAENRILSRAADDMQISQPALSRLLNQVEKKYAVRLFERRGRAGMIPNELGRGFIEHARHIIHEYNAIEDSFEISKGQPTGKISIAMTDSVAHMLCVPLVKQVKQHYPLVNLRVVTAINTEIPQQLYSGKVQIGIIADTQIMQGLRVKPIVSEKLHLVGPANVGKSTPAQVNLADVAQLPLILPALNGSIREHINQAFASAKLIPRIELEIDTQEGMLDLVKAGEGYSIMSYAGVHRHVLADDVSATPISNPSIERSFAIAVSNNKPKTLLIQTIERKLVELIQEFSELARWHYHT